MRNARARTGNLVDLVLVEDVHPRMERREQDRRIDVALVVRAEDGGAIGHVLLPDDLEPDAREHAAEAHAAVAEDVEHARPAERHRQQHADEAGDEDVEGNGDVGDDGAEWRRSARGGNHK